VADVSVAISLAMITLFLLICLVLVWWMFKSGYRLKQ
jgi:ABC-2 type transport system permease protein